MLRVGISVGAAADDRSSGMVTENPGFLPIRPRDSLTLLFPRLADLHWPPKVTQNTKEKA